MGDTLEPAISSQSPAKRAPHLFTSENAAEMGRRSWEARVAKRQAKLASAPLTVAVNEPANEYTALRLSCVRAQLARLDAMLLVETDAQKLDRLASAQARLSEQERVLDGRPLPGSRRPGKERLTAPAMLTPG